MVGAVLGDIAGSKWEFKQISQYYYDNLELFQEDSFFTDDTVMACATKWAIQNNVTYEEAYLYFYQRFPDLSYGFKFLLWANSVNKCPYGSYGNGSAMRVGYIGEYYNTEEKVIEEAIKSAVCTHNHEEGIKGAVTTALCTFYGRNKKCQYIKDYIKNDVKYTLYNSMEEIYQKTKYDLCMETCQDTMPIVLSCFLLSEDYSDCLRKILSINCDTDTCACIAGGIAENYYGGLGAIESRELLTKYINDDMLLDLLLY